MIVNSCPKKLVHMRTFSAASLHNKQPLGFLGQISALWQAEHLEGSGEEQASPSSFLLRICSASTALASSVCGRNNATDSYYPRT